MAATWISSIGFALLLLLCLSASARAAPSVSDLEQLGELERTLKELATSVLAMNGGFAGGGESGQERTSMLGMWRTIWSWTPTARLYWSI
ncbi:uncharacterized protein LOC115565195 isoform X1 [Drosophila navojoa]|uniref:uncharacterized protein LOC115565195 isoform X1 n=1 Tax=Drosophila navojoa TaxID=7232 RepID=UPI0008472169|nr:uncharacterized protein LOC115565195 isoform X1 [Drosophila navojoa]